MGRLPQKFAGLDIKKRIPYTMPGELIVAAGGSGVVFPDSVYTHNVDKPFEIHRMIPRITALDDNGDVRALLTGTADPELLERLVQIRIIATTQNETITKSNQRLDALTKGTSEKTWEWAEPYYLEKSSAFQITVAYLPPAAVSATTPSIRFDLTFQGFLLVIAPPSESRL